MKYLNILGFKAEEASRSYQQTDPLQPSHGPSLWPATSSTCRSHTEQLTFPLKERHQGKGGDSQMKLLLSSTTHTHSLLLVQPVSRVLLLQRVGDDNGVREDIRVSSHWSLTR